MYNVNISIDDISPHPQSSVKVLDKCLEMLKLFDDIKFTLFIPMAYQRLNQPSYPLSGYPSFCETLRNLSDKTFELGWHGLVHGIPGISNDNEFDKLSYDQAMRVIDRMFEMADLVGIKNKMKPIFRPPAFRLSPSSFKALEDRGIKLLALSKKPHMLSIYNGFDKEFSAKNKVVYYDVLPPSDPIRITDRTEMVFHACEWLDNYFSEKYVAEMTEVFTAKRVNFCFIEDL